MKPTPYNGILFTGLFRNRSIRNRALAHALATRDQGIVDRIAASIWEDDASENPEVVDQLAREGVELAIQPSPPTDPLFEKDGGNGVKQLMSLAVGIALFNPSDRVLKTRFDLVLSSERIRRLFAYDLDVKGTDWSVGIPATKIVIPAASVIRPFHIFDWYFLSSGQVLSRMASLDLALLRPHWHGYVGLPVRTMAGVGMGQYINLFLDNPLARVFLRLAPFFDVAAKHYEKTIRASLATSSFMALLSYYYFALHSSFVVDGPIGVEFYSRGEKPTNQYLGGVPRRLRIKRDCLRCNVVGCKFGVCSRILNRHFYSSDFVDGLFSSRVPERGDLRKLLEVWYSARQDWQETSREFMAEQTTLLESFYGRGSIDAYIHYGR